MAGQIIQRGDETWLLRIYLGQDRNKKRRYLNKTIHGSRRRAEAELRKLLHDHETGALVFPSKLTLDEYLDRWLDSAVKPRVRPQTLAEYRDCLDRYLRPCLGMRKLSNVTALEIHELLTRMQRARDEGGLGLNARTARHTRMLLNNAFKKAVQWRLLSHNPIEAVDAPRYRPKEMRALSPEQARLFLSEALKDKWHALWVVLLTGGLRPSEALALKWSDVEWERDAVSVKRALVRLRGEWTLDDPKTEKSRRTVVLPSIAMSALKDHRVRQAEQRLKAGESWSDHGLVFASRNGAPLHLRNLRRRHLNKILERAKLPTLTLYQLRHSCATLLLSAGEHPKVVSERLGHSTITLTMDTYSHVLEGMQVAAAERMGLLLSDDTARTSRG